MTTQVGDTWYRYVDVRFAPSVNEWNEPTGPSTLRVMLLKYKVIKITPCGVRLDNDRFVLNTARKRFACASVEQAKDSFVARKNRQAGIYQARLNQALDAIRLINMEEDFT